MSVVDCVGTCSYKERGVYILLCMVNLREMDGTKTRTNKTIMGHAKNALWPIYFCVR